MSRLRQIAIHIEEPKSGLYAWVLSERGAKDWTVLSRSTSESDTYHKAMADGLLELQALVKDLRIGPRAGNGTVRPQQPQDERAASGIAGKPGKNYFGFGPAR